MRVQQWTRSGRLRASPSLARFLAYPWLAGAILGVPACSERDNPLVVQPELSPLFAIGVEGSPVNLTNQPDAQLLANVSGDFVVWVDRRNGLPAEIWGCDVSISLGECSGSAVRLATDAYDSASEGLGISGSVLVWSTPPLGSTTPRELRGCDLGASLSADECVGEGNYTALANQAAFPEVSGSTVIWLDLNATALAGCDVSDGLAMCAGTTQKLNPDDKAPLVSTDPGTDGSFVAWRNGIGDGSGMFACDIRGGLSQCVSNAQLIASGRLAAAIHPAISNGRVVWSGLWEGALDIVGCDLSGGVNLCAVTSLTEGLGASETEPDVDGSVVVWRGGGLKACEFATNAFACDSAPVGVSSSGVRPSVSGSTVVWHLSGEVYGVRLSGVPDDDPPAPGENNPPVADAGPDQTSTSGPLPRQINLDGSASLDPDPQDVLTYHWTEDERLLGEGETVEVSLGPGRHTINLAVSDGSLESLDEVVVTVQKEVVILIHGWSDEPSDFGSTASFLSSRFELIFYDYSDLTQVVEVPGPSPNCVASGTPVEDIATDFAFWLHRDDSPTRPGFPAELRGRPINVVAHSLGGAIALAYVAGLSNDAAPRYEPGDFDHVITMGTPFYGTKWSSLNNIGSCPGGRIRGAGGQAEDLKTGSEFVWNLHQARQESSTLRGDKLLTVAGTRPRDPEEDGLVTIWSAVRPSREAAPIAYAPCRHSPGALSAGADCTLNNMPEDDAFPMLGIIVPFLNEGRVESAAQPPLPAADQGLLLVRVESARGSSFPGFEPEIQLFQRATGAVYECDGDGDLECEYNEATGAVTIWPISAGSYSVFIRNKPRRYKAFDIVEDVEIDAGRPAGVKFVFTRSL